MNYNHAKIKFYTLKSLIITCMLSSVVFMPMALFSQNASPQEDDEVIRLSTDLVVLNITVTNSAGDFVHNLRQSDFKILEDNRECSINTFSLEDTPFAAAILLDTSGSMESKMTLARAAAVRFLDGLRTDDVAAVYQFNSEIEQLQDFSPSKDLVDMAYGLKAKGMTVLNDAIVRSAIDISKRDEKRKAIIILSDGADTFSKASNEKALTAALSIGATIYAVDMSGTNEAATSIQPTGALVLKEMAAKTGGRFVRTPGGQGLREAFANIVKELSNQYTVGYIPSKPITDDKWRTIEVKLSNSKLTVRTRRGYKPSTPSKHVKKPKNSSLPYKSSGNI
jgi:Ca-activated chloride channel homolog